MRFKVADHDFVDPFTASDEEEGAAKAIKIMGHGFETKQRVKRVGALTVLAELGLRLVLSL